MSAHIPAIVSQDIPAGLLPLLDDLCAAACTVTEHLHGPETGQGLIWEIETVFLEAIRGTNVRWYDSLFRSEAMELAERGRFAITLFPLDNVQNMETGFPSGTVFSVYAAGDNAEESFLRPAREQLAAGYFIYGSRTSLIVTFGAGTLQFNLNGPERRFEPASRMGNEGLRVPAETAEYAVNAANYRHWPRPIRAFVDDCVDGTDGPRGRDFNMHWLDSIVGEAHRILLRGGIFLNPAGDRASGTRGHADMLHTCAPIALIMEQAGGAATDGIEPVLAQRISERDMQIPLVFGSAAKVEKVTTYFDLPENETAALFGKRGLFRS